MHKRADGAMIQYVVYDKPLDFPESVVVRRWFITGDGRLEPDRFPWSVRETIAEARGTIPNSLFRMERAPSDDACIVEVYV